MSMETQSAVEETRSLIVKATAIKVENPPTRQDAATLWSLIRTARKAVETEQEEVCGPLKKDYEDKRAPYLELRKECESWEKRLQAAMSAWDREQDRLAREEQAKIQAKIDAENAKKLAKAEEKGKDLSEVVLKVAAVVQAPPKSIETQAGTVSTRVEKTVYGIVNATDNEDLKANDPRISSLLDSFPALFAFDWVTFRKLASTGMLNGNKQVVSRTEYIYTQRSGR